MCHNVANAFFNYLIGSRGFIQEIWPEDRNTNVDDVRTKFTSTFPVNSTLTYEYATQRLNSRISRYNNRFKFLSARYEGFLKPPYTGYFNLLISGDDFLEFWLSFNRSSIGMVRSHAFLCCFYCRAVIVL